MHGSLAKDREGINPSVDLKLTEPFYQKQLKLVRINIQYQLCPMPYKDEIKNSSSYQSYKLYIEKQGDDLQYKVRNSDNELITAKITKEKFQPKIPAFSRVAQVKLFLPIFLKIIVKKGHIQAGQMIWYDLSELKEGIKFNKDKDKDTLFIRSHEDCLEYKVFNSKGNLVTDKITQKEFYDAILEPIDIDLFSSKNAR